MWRRFAGGSAKRKCGVLEIEDGEEEITGSWRGTAAPNTSTPVSSRERTEVESTKGSSRAMAVPNKPPTVSRKGEESPLTTGTASARTTAVPNKPPAVFRKQEESPSTGTGSSRTMAVPSTPISSRRRTLPGVVATPPPAVSSFRRFSSPFSGKRSHSGSPIVVKEEIPSQLSNLARAPSVKRGNSSCYSIFSSPMTLKREPTEPDDDYQIESQAGSPEKQVSAEEGIIEHEESVLSQWSQHNERFTIARTQDLPSSPSFPVERPTVTQPNVSPKKKRRKFHGFAGRLASHLTAARAERVLSRRDPNVETMEVLIKKTVRCWGVTSSFLSSGHQLFSRRNEPVPSKGPASAVQGPAPLRRRLVLPLAQLAIHPRRPPALLHPVFSLVPDGIHEQKLRKAK